jgi:prepilin-type N-terminal cleavage/methylation domain-containing protein
MKKSAFTLIEILVCIAICTIIGTIGITFMSRGASNVARGSFNTIAANQAAYIIYTIRSDISRSNAEKITFNADSENSWTGDGEFKIVYASDKTQKAVYTIGSPSNLKTFVRVDPNGRKQSLGAEYLSDLKITQVTENNLVGYKIEIKMLESDKSNFPVIWNSTVYPPQSSPAGNFWKGVTQP